MRSYLLSILAVSLAAALLFHLLPEKTSFGKGLKFLSSLLLLLLLFSPLAGAKEAITDFFSGDWELDQKALEDSYAEKSRDSLLLHSKEYLETLVQEKLVKEFSLRKEDLSVRLRLEEGEPKEVVLILSGKAIWQDSAKMENFVKDLLGLDCSSFIE